MADSDHQTTALLQGNRGEGGGKKDAHPCPYRTLKTCCHIWGREGERRAATPLTAHSQNGWRRKEVAEVALLPCFSKEERESNLATACCVWDRAGRKLGKQDTDHLLIQHTEIQQKSWPPRWESCPWSGILPLKLPRLEYAELGREFPQARSMGLLLVLSPAAWDLLALTAVSAEPHTSSTFAVTETGSSPATSESFLCFLTQIQEASFCESPVSSPVVILLVKHGVRHKTSCSQSQ